MSRDRWRVAWIAMVKGKRELVNRGIRELANRRASFLVYRCEEHYPKWHCQRFWWGSKIKTTRRVIMVQTIPPPATKDQPTFFTPNLSSLRLTHDQFWDVCRDNPELRLELTSDGE